jgi:hypothetical protein
MSKHTERRRALRHEKLFVCEWCVFRSQGKESGQFTVKACHAVPALVAARKFVRAHADGDRYECAVRPANIGERIIDRLTPGEHVSPYYSPLCPPIANLGSNIFQLQPDAGAKQNPGP